MEKIDTAADEIAQMVERRTVEPEALGSNPTVCKFFVPCCSMSQAIGCIKYLPNGRMTQYKCIRLDMADNNRPYDTMITLGDYICPKKIMEKSSLSAK